MSRTQPEGSPTWPAPTWEQVGFTAYAARRRLGLTQAEVARRSGVSRAWIVSFERGHPHADPQNALRVLSALGLEIVVRPAQITERQRLADQALAIVLGEEDD